MANIKNRKHLILHKTICIGTSKKIYTTAVAEADK